MMSTGIVFPSDERIPLSTREFDSLEDSQSAIDGDIKAINVCEIGLSFLADDEAKLIGLTFNRRAADYWWLHLHPNQSRDPLCVDVVLVGPANKRDEAPSVPDSFQFLLFTPLTYAVETKAQGATRSHSAPHLFGGYFDADAWGLDLAQRRTAIEHIRVVVRA